MDVFRNSQNTGQQGYLNSGRIIHIKDIYVNNPKIKYKQIVHHIMYKTNIYKQRYNAHKNINTHTYLTMVQW